MPILSPARVYRLARSAGFAPRRAAVMVAIAARESGFNSNAVNRSSGACGLFQSYPCPGPMTPAQQAANAYAKARASEAAGYPWWRPWASSGGLPAPYPGVGDVRRKGHRAPRHGTHPRLEARGAGATIAGMGPCIGGSGGGFKGAVGNVINQGLAELGRATIRTCSCDERYPSGSKTLGVIPTGGAQNLLCKLPRYMEVAAGGAVMALGLTVLVVSATGGAPSLPSVAALSALKGVTRAPRASRTAAAAPARPDLSADRAAGSAARREAAEQLARRRRAEADVSEHYADVTLERKRPRGTQRRPTLHRSTGEEVRV
jgi:hypothetical protein